MKICHCKSLEYDLSRRVLGAQSTSSVDKLSRQPQRALSSGWGQDFLYRTAPHARWIGLRGQSPQGQRVSLTVGDCRAYHTTVVATLQWNRQRNPEMRRREVGVKTRPLDGRNLGTDVALRGVALLPTRATPTRPSERNIPSRSYRPCSATMSRAPGFPLRALSPSAAYNIRLRQLRLSLERRPRRAAFFKPPPAITHTLLVFLVCLIRPPRFFNKWRLTPGTLRFCSLFATGPVQPL